MPDTSLGEIMDALADQIRGTLAADADPLIPGLQVEPRLVYNPTPPALDIYPAEPFQSGVAFGAGNSEFFLSVRARVNTPDSEGAQDVLLEMMDPRSDESVALAILSDRTLSGKVENLNVSDGPSSFGIFVDPGGGGSFLGCTWTVQVIP